MKLTTMDADLAKISDPEQLSRRLSYWETRWQLTRGRDEQADAEYQEICRKHSLRCAKVLGAG